MKFSVLIPVYNTEKYINDCFQSVLRQSYTDYEVIIVDDGSTDSSSKICDRLATEYPKTVQVIHQKNQGQLVSRCNAIKKATGDYCIFMDSDDIIIDSALAQIKNAIEDNCFPDIILYPFFYEKNGKKTISQRFNDGDKFFEKEHIKSVRELFFTTSIMGSMCTKAIKREVLLKSIYNIGDYAKLRCSEDKLHAMWVLDNVSTAFYLDEPLYIYRLFDGSTTRSFSFDAIERNITVPLYSIEKEYLLKWGFDSKEWLQRFDAGWISYMIYVFLLFYSKCPRNEKKSIMSYPWNTFIPEALTEMNFKNNRFLNPVKNKLYKDILSKDKKEIDRYIFKRNMYNILKQIKRKIIN